MTIVDMVIDLMNIDLIKDRHVWKTKCNEIKLMIDQLNYNEQMSWAWKVHIDFQLYKSLEFQYKAGLEKLNEYLEEIRADVVVKDKAIRFNPPLEELKTKYYVAISNFITFPLTFPGVGGKQAIFSAISEKNNEGLIIVYEKAEALFDKLEEIVTQLAPWSALNYVDIEAYIDEHFK